MRTNLTLEDVKKIVESIYNGNLAQSIASNGDIPYENDNSESIVIYDESGREIGEYDLAKYLNLHFYTWRNRVVDSAPDAKEPFEAWVESLSVSMNDAYALVEVTNNTAVASQDIDNATITGRVTIIIQANKVANLDYYASKIHNKFLGEPQGIINAYGDELKAYMNMGILLYDEEPVTMQLGECVTVSFNFSINYLTDTYTYTDTKMSFSFDGENFSQIPVSTANMQTILTFKSVPYNGRPDLAGVINEVASTAWALLFYDFKDDPFVIEFNKLFYSIGARKINDEAISVIDINIPIYVKVEVHYHNEESPTVYEYEFTATEMSKKVTNGDFNINSLTLRGRSQAGV